MICKNCNKEIGQKTECAFCGYDPAKDGEGAVYVGNGEEYAVLPPVKIKLLEKSNDMAVAAFIFSFPLLSVSPLFWLMGLIFAIQGLKKAKYCRSGKGLCVTSLIFCFLVLLAYIALLVYYLAMMGVLPIDVSGISEVLG